MPGIDENELEAQVEREKLHNALIRSFDLTELKILCMVLGIRAEDVVCGNLAESVFQLVEYCFHRSMLVDLVTYLISKRPHIAISDLLKAGALLPVSAYDRFEFANRTEELRLACPTGARPFILISAPAGYGKTYLLHRLRRRYEHEESVSWRAGYVDLKPSAVMRGKDEGVALLYMVNALIASFHQRPPVREIRSGADETAIYHRLSTFLTGQLSNSPGALVMWDGVEVLPDETGTMLQNMMVKLSQHLQAQHKKLVVVFSGRYVRNWGKGISDAARTTIVLTPFDSAVVRQMIAERAARLNIALPSEAYLDDLTWNVLDLSGGHPHGICSVVDRISEDNLVFDELAYAFFSVNEYHYGEHVGTLYQVCIEPIIHVLTDELEPLLRPIFQRLSPVRRYSPAILDYLVDKHLITLPPHIGDGWALLKAMQDTHLVRKPTKGDRMSSDHIVRRMLAVQLRITDKQEFARINAAAEELFDGWAGNRSRIEAQLWWTAVIESLYHTLQPEPQEPTPDALRDVVLGKARRYMAQITDDEDLDQLDDALDKDQEFKDLLRRRTGDRTLQLLTDLFDVRRRQILAQRSSGPYPA